MPAKLDVSARPRRITVVLSGTQSNRLLLDMLAFVTSGAPAEVQGLYVEDMELLRVAGLPFVKELCAITGEERRLDPAEIQQRFKVQAEGARRALEDTTTRIHVAHTFRAVRAAGAALLREVAADMDLTLVGPAWPEYRPAAQARLRAGRAAAGRPVIAIYDQSEVGERALKVAGGLAGAAAWPLTVLLAEDTEQARAGVSKLLGMPVSFRLLSGRGVEALLENARREKAGALVLGMTEELLELEVLRILRERLDRPAVLVR